MYIFPYGLYPVLMKDAACCSVLGSRDAVPPCATRVKLCHSPPEFQPCPGLVVPLRTSAPEWGKERSGKGFISSNKIFREKVLQSKPTWISVFPKVPMPGDPSGADGSLPTLHFSAALNSYCLFPSWKPISESQSWGLAFLFYCLPRPKLQFRENEGKHHPTDRSMPKLFLADR